MIVGLTGGIGSGKSTVARIFQLLGAAVFDSDAAAKAAYLLPLVKPRVLALLGLPAYSTDGSINRQFISETVFQNPSLLKELNDILHPAVQQQMQEFVNTHRGKLIVKESALLFEAGLQDQVDKIIVVDAPELLRIQRTMKRDALSEIAVKSRMQSQWPVAEKLKKADFVIVNDDTRPVIPQVLAIYTALTGKNVS
jgi:dephospho-CoA kinase